MSGFDVDLWYGLLAPAGTSPEIVARYNSVLNEILAQASVREALAKQGMDARGGPPGASCGIDCQRSAALVQGGQGCRHYARVTTVAGSVAR